MTPMGATDYRDGARERLSEAFLLLQNDRFSGSIYLSGRAVEGMLRAVLWKNDAQFSNGTKTLETGHNLRQMFKMVENLGVLRNNPLRDALSHDIDRIAILWSNNMRFWPFAKIKAVWYDLGGTGRKRTPKPAAHQFFQICSTTVKGCEELC